MASSASSHAAFDTEFADFAAAAGLDVVGHTTSTTSPTTLSLSLKETPATEDIWEIVRSGVGSGRRYRARPWRLPHPRRLRRLRLVWLMGHWTPVSPRTKPSPFAQDVAAKPDPGGGCGSPGACRPIEGTALGGSRKRPLVEPKPKAFIKASAFRPSGRPLLRRIL